MVTQSTIDTPPLMCDFSGDRNNLDVGITNYATSSGLGADPGGEGWRVAT